METLFTLLLTITALFVSVNLVVLSLFPAVHTGPFWQLKNFTVTDTRIVSTQNDTKTNGEIESLESPSFFWIKGDTNDNLSPQKYDKTSPANQLPPDMPTSTLCRVIPLKCSTDRLAINLLTTTIWKTNSTRLISIRGERHSGTKLARKLIQKNTNGLLDSTTSKSYADDVYGWKHGFFFSDGAVHPSDVILILVRDVFSWAIAMFKEPYNMMFDQGMTDFGTFLQGNYRTQHCLYTWAQIPKKCNFPMEQAPNIIQLRTAKYKNWTGMLHTQFSLMQYEHLANNQAATMIRLFHQFGIKNRTSVFQKITNYVGIGNIEVLPITDKTPQKIRDKYKMTYTEEQINFHLETEREKYLSQYTVEQIEFVLRNLDLEFERKVLDYTYDDVKQYLDDRRSGKKMYMGPPILSHEGVQKRSLLNQMWENASIPCYQYSC